MERKLGVSEARGIFGKLIERVQYQKDTYVINRRGKPVAAVVPLDVYESWKRQRQEFFAAIRSIQDSNPDADPDVTMEDVLEAQQAVSCLDN